MHITPSAALPDIPPIVLLVDEDRDALSSYSAYFEASGVWVATSTAPVEALDAVQELKPDLVVTDMGFQGTQAGVDLVHTLKSRAETRNTPLIVLAGSAVPDTARQEADLCLVKPVKPDDLLVTVRRLLDHSRVLRERSEKARARTAELADRSMRVLHKSKALADQAESYRRICPNCSAPLDWIERGRVGGILYDYYRWCIKGCGLYCYELDSRKWVKLA